MSPTLSLKNRYKLKIKNLVDLQGENIFFNQLLRNEQYNTIKSYRKSVSPSHK
jgi:hypothetical protein